MKKTLGIFALAALIAVPAAGFASTFAYVNTSGEVTSIEATDANTALRTAPNMDIHSGVMLISGSNTNIVGNTVTQ
ncbi:MAG: hypothetical protein JWL75_639 [Parcubacteria group bacterium]|nr:hypothetical protein [Parcubacteria group bacterium]